MPPIRTCAIPADGEGQVAYLHRYIPVVGQQRQLPRLSFRLLQAQAPGRAGGGLCLCGLLEVSANGVGEGAKEGDS